MDKTTYFKTIIDQYKTLSKCTMHIKDEAVKSVTVAFNNGAVKVFEGETLNSCAYAMQEHMRSDYFKENYFKPLSKRRIINYE